MGVSTFVQPDFDGQSAAVYKAAIDAAVQVLAHIGGAYAAHEQATPDMTVRLDAGTLFVGVTVVENAAQSTGTITAPSANPRIDRVVIDDATGVVSVITGSEAPSPVAPAIATSKLPICQVLLDNSPATTSIGNSLITDERVSPGSGSDLPAGILAPYTGATAPVGWLLCDGTTGLDSTTDLTLAALFAVIGTTYGGTGSSDFDLPDMRGRVPGGLDNLGGTSANRVVAAAADSLGGSVGTETHTLTIAQMPVHNHSVGNQTAPTFGQPAGEIGTTSGVTGTTGDGLAHPNMQPTLFVAYIIKK